jgi:SHS2 domain-containing protein
MEPFHEIRRDADTVTMRAFGATRYELVEHAAMAMFSVGRELATIAPTYSRPLVAPGDTLQELIRGWLEELLLLGDEAGIVWSQATVDRLEVGGVQGSAAGQYRTAMAPLGPVATGVASVGPVVEIPDGFWVDVTLQIDTVLRVV